MRVVVLGATGNVGTSVVRALSADPAVKSIVGVARRRPRLVVDKVGWSTADIRHADLTGLLRGADAAVHLAWLIQPARDPMALRSVNVDGTARVLRAVAEADVPTLAYASSVGAYSPGPKDQAVDESWPTDGLTTSFYARHKAEVETMLDHFERDRPGTRVVRLRPGLIFKREAASGIRRLFAGPLLPSPLVEPGLVPVVPDVKGLRFQAVHSLDVGEAFRLAIRNEVSGAFNVAADPVLDPAELGRLLGARRVPVPAPAVRAVTSASYALRLQPTSSGWVDMALCMPVMNSRRAREELGWHPRWTSGEALLDLMGGLRDRAGEDTPPLSPHTGGPLRLRELATGVGAR